MKRAIRDWLSVLLLFFDEAVAVALVLLLLWLLRIRLPLWVGIVLALILGALAFIMHKLVIPSFRRKQVTGAEAMVGLVGKVIEPLAPFGVIRVKDEYWKAKSVSGEIAKGKAVEILALNGLTTMVKLKSE